MVSGFLAAFAGPIATGPFDVAKTRMMAQEKGVSAAPRLAITLKLSLISTRLRSKKNRGRFAYFDFLAWFGI
jgi:hypothetical protein